MPEELDADVTVVDSTPADDSGGDGGSDDNGSDSSSSDGLDNDVIQLTDVEGEDGFRKTQDQLEEDIATGNTENLSQAPNTEEPNTVTEDLVTTTEQEKQADVNLSGLQDTSGKQLTESEALEQLQKNPKDVELGPGARSSTSAKVESRRNRRENILQERRNELSQKSKVPGIDRDNVVVGSRQDPLDNAARDFFNPNRQVSENLNTAGEAVLAGQNIIRNNEEFGERTEEKIPDSLNFLGSGIGGAIAGAEKIAQGNVGQGLESFFIPGNQNELEEKRSEQVRQGVFAGPGTLVGFGVGGAGAVAKAGEQELNKIQGEETEGPGFGGSLVGGAARIQNQVSQNPGRFAANEIGEEIGEGIATAGVGLAVPTITPDITPTVRAQTPDSVQTTARFITGNLGTRPREPDTRINLEDTEVLQREFIDNPDGDGRAQVVEGFRFTEGGTQVSTGGGVRPETPVSRREFLAERTGLRDAELADLLPTSSRKGTTSGIPLIKESTPETTPETTPDNDINPDDLFRDPDSFSPEPESITTPEFTPGLRLEDAVETDQSLDQGQGLDNFEEEINPPREEQRLEQETTPETKPEPFLENFLVPEEELIPDTRFEARPDPTTTFTPDPDSDNDEQELLFGEPVQEEVDQSTRFAASLAGLFGAEGVSETGEALTGLEIREPTSDEDPLDGL